MNKIINYKPIIDVITKSIRTIINQKLAKKLVNDELPKSCFDKNYLKSGKNELARFLIEYKNIYEYEIIPAQIIVSKKIS